MKITQPLVELPRSKLAFPLKHMAILHFFSDETSVLWFAADTKLFPCSALFNLISDSPYNYFLCFCNFLLVVLIPFCVGADHVLPVRHPLLPWGPLSLSFSWLSLPGSSVLGFCSSPLFARNDSPSALSSPITFVLTAKLRKLDPLVVTSDASLSAQHFHYGLAQSWELRSGLFHFKSTVKYCEHEGRLLCINKSLVKFTPVMEGLFHVSRYFNYQHQHPENCERLPVK